ncbi:hypothetical protein B0T17DRAFT_540347 [Bombardia bombarda]|uniref:Secreted protein n=1 Tax=Bombardia bombarda TaxID=252184 RepID=A0AA40BV90_9PEZI|nr:hypothetical protein B0T17DRAFT_540347 [Bombardia bombarda]
MQDTKQWFLLFAGVDLMLLLSSPLPLPFLASPSSPPHPGEFPKRLKREWHRWEGLVIVREGARFQHSERASNPTLR